MTIYDTEQFKLSAVSLENLAFVYVSCKYGELACTDTFSYSLITISVSS